MEKKDKKFIVERKVLKKPEKIELDSNEIVIEENDVQVSEEIFSYDDLVIDEAAVENDFIEIKEEISNNDLMIDEAAVEDSSLEIISVNNTNLKDVSLENMRKSSKIRYKSSSKIAIFFIFLIVCLSVSLVFLLTMFFAKNNQKTAYDVFSNAKTFNVNADKFAITGTLETDDSKNKDNYSFSAKIDFEKQLGELSFGTENSKNSYIIDANNKFLYYFDNIKNVWKSIDSQNNDLNKYGFGEIIKNISAPKKNVDSNIKKMINSNFKVTTSGNKDIVSLKKKIAINDVLNAINPNIMEEIKKNEYLNNIVDQGINPEGILKQIKIVEINLIYIDHVLSEVEFVSKIDVFVFKYGIKLNLDFDYDSDVKIVVPDKSDDSNKDDFLKNYKLDNGSYEVGKDIKAGVYNVVIPSGSFSINGRLENRANQMIYQDVRLENGDLIEIRDLKKNETINFEETFK